MFATRSRATCAARQLQRAARTTRTYASDAHHKAAPVNESFGKGSLIAVSAIFSIALAYKLAPREGEDSALRNLLTKYRSQAEHWEEINALHTKAAEQAGFDRNLFENGSNQHRFVDVAYPEAIHSHAPRNIQAGQLSNIDHVVEHYRQQHLKEEERKTAKLSQQQ